MHHHVKCGAKTNCTTQSTNECDIVVAHFFSPYLVKSELSFTKLNEIRSFWFFVEIGKFWAKAKKKPPY
jgi:hypothetical protein